MRFCFALSGSSKVLMVFEEVFTFEKSVCFILSKCRSNVPTCGDLMKPADG